MEPSVLETRAASPASSRRYRAWLLFGATLLAFVSWISWLGWLALTTSRPTVLARPQLLISTTDVIAQIDDLDTPRIRVTEVLSPGTFVGRTGDELAIPNLSKCSGWSGPGGYLVPLHKPIGAKDFEVAAMPREPGFPLRDLTDDAARAPHVYRWTAEVREQYNSVRKLP